MVKWVHLGGPIQPAGLGFYILPGRGHGPAHWRPFARYASRYSDVHVLTLGQPLPKSSNGRVGSVQRLIDLSNSIRPLLTDRNEIRVFIGHSAGAVLALELAVADGGRAGLVLVEPVPTHFLTMDSRESSFGLAATNSAVGADDPTGLVERYPFSDLDLLRRIENESGPISPETAEERVLPEDTDDRRRYLRDLSSHAPVSVAVIKGQFSSVLSTDAARNIVALLPSKSFVAQLNRAGHSPHLDVPNELARFTRSYGESKFRPLASTGSADVEGLNIENDLG